MIGGTDISAAKTAQEAMQIAGLDFNVQLDPLFLANTSPVFGKMILGSRCSQKQAVTRCDDREILGVVGTKYKPIQPKDCFSMLDKAIGSENVSYNEAGKIKGGIWVDLNTGNDFNVGPEGNNDKIEKHIILTNTFDGSKSLSGYFVGQRLACMNQLTSQTRIFKIRHSRNAERAMEDAIQLIKKAVGYFKWFDKECNMLFHAPMTDRQMADFVTKLVPATKIINDNGFIDGLVSTRKLNIRNEMNRLFHEGTGLENCHNTRWAAYNAISEYTDHNRTVAVRKGRNADVVRFESTLMGSGANLKAKAFELLQVN